MKHWLILLAFWLLVPVSASAETPQERWNQLSPADKERVRENFKHFKAMPENERKQAREKFERFKTLPPEVKQRLRDRFQHFKNLPPERQQQIRERFGKFMRLSPDQRRQRIQQLRERRLQNPGARPFRRRNR